MVNNSELPRISIVTPSYNQGQFIEETIQSVLSQGYPNLEYIIIDGGSTDNTVEIIKRYEKWIDFWISEPDDGQADAIRKGFVKATGDILAWINSDDIYVPGIFFRIAEVFMTTSSDVVFGHEYIIDEFGRIIGERLSTPYPKSLGKYFLTFGGYHIYQPASFWKRNLYERVGRIDVRYQYNMDTDLFARFALASSQFELLDDYVVMFRVHRWAKSTRDHTSGFYERSLIGKQYQINIPKFLGGRFGLRLLGRIYRSYSYVRMRRSKHLLMLLYNRMVIGKISYPEVRLY